MLRKLLTLASAVGLLAGSAVVAVGAVSASTCTREPALVDISAMDDTERANYDARPCDVQLTSYVKIFIPFDASGRPGSPIRVTPAPIASVGSYVSSRTALDASRTDDHGLYLSISASRNLHTGYCADWDFAGYFNWTTGYPLFDYNLGYDFWGIEWSGNLQNDLGPSAYSYDDFPSPTIYQHSLAQTFNNVGYVMRFYEHASTGQSEKYGYFYTGARQVTCNNLGQTVNLQYTHTFATTSYSVSGSPSGLGFTLSPGTDQWQFAVPTSFTS